MGNQHPELENFYWGERGDRHIWSPSYFVESIGTTNEAAVAKYIADQREKDVRHEQKSKKMQGN